MQWEHLTASELADAARDIGVCIVVVGVMEKHDEHLPLGTDMMLGHGIACRAAEKEEAVVFPPYYFGQVFEASCFPGAVALRPTLLIELAQCIFDEIARNGFRKIILFNSHGGNKGFMKLLTECSVAEEKPYTLYAAKDFVIPEFHEAHQAVCPFPPYEHGGVIETSLGYALFPELVREDRIPADSVAQGRLDHLPGLMTGVEWFADFPEHTAGNAGDASPERGKALLDIYVNSMARQIEAVKADEKAPALQKYFFEKRRALSQNEII